MANWLTIKQLSEKRDIAESTLRNWINLGYITSSTIDNVIMLDDDSLISYLDTHQTKGLNKESPEKLIKEKKMECEIILSPPRRRTVPFKNPKPSPTAFSYHRARARTTDYQRHSTGNIPSHLHWRTDLTRSSTAKHDLSGNNGGLQQYPQKIK